MFQGSFKGVPKRFLGCFKEVSRKIEVCFNGVHGCLKEVQWVFEEIFKGVSRKFKCFSRWRGVPRDLQGSFKGIKKSSKGVSRQFQRHFKEVLGVSSVF